MGRHSALGAHTLGVWQTRSYLCGVITRCGHRNQIHCRQCEFVIQMSQKTHVKTGLDLRFDQSYSGVFHVKDGVMLDLSTCFNEDGSEKPDSKHVDLSERPIPKGVVLTLDSGIDVQCEVKYTGHWEQDKRFRRYNIVAEVDWLKHRVSRITVDENPMDVVLLLDFPDSLDSDVREELYRMMSSVQFYCRKTV